MNKQTNETGRVIILMYADLCGCTFVIISVSTHLAQQSKTGYDTPSTDRAKTDADTHTIKIHRHAKKHTKKNNAIRRRVQI